MLSIKLFFLFHMNLLFFSGRFCFPGYFFGDIFLTLLSSCFIPILLSYDLPWKAGKSKDMLNEDHSAAIRRSFPSLVLNDFHEDCNTTTVVDSPEECIH